MTDKTQISIVVQGLGNSGRTAIGLKIAEVLRAAGFEITGPIADADSKGLDAEWRDEVLSRVAGTTQITISKSAVPEYLEASRKPLTRLEQLQAMSLKHAEPTLLGSGSVTERDAMIASHLEQCLKLVQQPADQPPVESASPETPFLVHVHPVGALSTPKECLEHAEVDTTTPAAQKLQEEFLAAQQPGAVPIDMDQVKKDLGACLAAGGYDLENIATKLMISCYMVGLEANWLTDDLSTPPRQKP